MIEILIADDQALIRRGLRLILESEPDLRVVAEAGDGQAAVAAAAATTPDVVLMDLRMPTMDGIEAIRALPRATKALVLTTFSDDALVYAALRAGASGYLLKTAPPEHLVGAVRSVAAGDALLDPRITQRLIDEVLTRPAPDARRAIAALTDRELEVLEGVARGHSNREIATASHLSEATVKTYLSRILTKTDRRDRAQLVVLAYETGLIRPGRP
ncbi:response regulator transcription factor [Allobranchiibius sp. CTAmp26]|uniref:response regulator transcription factor n=1 Tax=Allobranchiibius sp. CTAmp26 TaxID=2815214 RepID=UPI001AA0BFF7|nr:response regulator transcription factor [Allobranchiibius sp. CTAmp26]MBO1754389.1 response regulator transcription factor [Allobranchiibius sp. CTAmp26]